MQESGCELPVRSSMEAKHRGLKRYYTGVACVKGHASERYVSTGGCVMCLKAADSKRSRLPSAEACARAAEYRRRYPDKIKARKALYNTRNKEKVKAYNSAYARAHKDKRAQYTRRWMADRPDRIREYKSRYYRKHRQKCLEKTYERREYVRRATPPWADREAIAAVYAEAARLTEETGIPHDVDHIEPLRGRDRCGLHIHWNLRPLPAHQNRKKSNRTNDHG